MFSCPTPRCPELHSRVRAIRNKSDHQRLTAVSLWLIKRTEVPIPMKNRHGSCLGNLWLPYQIWCISNSYFLSKPRSFSELNHRYKKDVLSRIGIGRSCNRSMEFRREFLVIVRVSWTILQLIDLRLDPDTENKNRSLVNQNPCAGTRRVEKPNHQREPPDRFRPHFVFWSQAHYDIQIPRD
jgi:hypothetical protein